MSCSRKLNNICTKYNTQCNIEPETMCAQYLDNSFCKHYQDNGVCSIHMMFCNIPYDECKDYVSNAEWNNTHSDPNKICDIKTKPYCKYCFNARVYKPTDEELMDPFATELTDDNDFSSCSVGESSMGTRFMISSGNGEPVRLEIDKFFEDYQEWYTVGKYYPKYCPECGRRLDEYDKV